jgi:catechol 2,3-dioxygenase-like lactoylglutathione lyase family enzyme
MSVRAGWSTPLLSVESIERSIPFYRELGFETIDVEGEAGGLGWARMHCEGGAIMLLRSDEPASSIEDRFLLYLYTPDLPALRARLVAAGVEVTRIQHPEHMRSGEMSFRDPDGYTIMVGHWAETEHEAWLRRIEEKRAAGLI